MTDKTNRARSARATHSCEAFTPALISLLTAHACTSVKPGEQQAAAADDISHLSGAQQTIFVSIAAERRALCCCWWLCSLPTDILQRIRIAQWIVYVTAL